MKYASIEDRDLEQAYLGNKEGIYFYLSKQKALSPLVHGLKFHLSFRADQVEAAWDAIESILLTEDCPFDVLKVLDTSENCEIDDDTDEEEALKIQRATQGMQVTLYVMGDVNDAFLSTKTLAKIADRLKVIDDALTAVGIEPGLIPDSDHPLTRFVSTRYTANGNEAYVAGIHSKGEHNWRIRREVAWIGDHNGWDVAPIAPRDDTIPAPLHHLLDWYNELAQMTSSYFSTPDQRTRAKAQMAMISETLAHSTHDSITALDRLVFIEFNFRQSNKFDDSLTYFGEYSSIMLLNALTSTQAAISPHKTALADISDYELVKQHFNTAFPLTATERDKWDWDKNFREKIFFPPYLYFFIECSKQEARDENIQQFYDITYKLALDIISISITQGLDPQLALRLQNAPQLLDEVRERVIATDDDSLTPTDFERQLTRLTDKAKVENDLAITKAVTAEIGPGHPF